MLQNEPLVAKIGVDTTENELSQVCLKQACAIPNPGPKSGSVDKDREDRHVEDKLNDVRGVRPAAGRENLRDDHRNLRARKFVSIRESIENNETEE